MFAWTFFSKYEKINSKYDEIDDYTNLKQNNLQIVNILKITVKQIRRHCLFIHKMSAWSFFLSLRKTIQNPMK